MQPENPFLPDGGFDPQRLLHPRDALATYFARVAVAPPAIELIALRDAFERVLGSDIVADRDYPDAPRSAMDGFALAAGAQRYRIVASVHMGRALDITVEPGQCVRIPTGGVVPRGCDAVVPIEDVSESGDAIDVSVPVPPGDNVIAAASDMQAGETVLSRGCRIRAADAALLATLGVARVPVLRRPRVAVLSSGDELVEPSATPEPGQIRDSNRYAVAATLTRFGCDVEHRPSASDEPGALEDALRAALDDGVQAIVLTGGSSVGERDGTPRAIAALGDPGVVVHGLRVKPGKPTVFGAVDGRPIVGLPGNPTSALMILQAVARPIFEALTGGPIAPDATEVVLADAVSSRSGWTWYIPVRIEDEGGSPMAHPLRLRSSSVSLIARASGYVVMDEHEERWNSGAPVRVHRFI